MVDAKTAAAGNVVPGEWKAMDEFAAGIDGNRIAATDRLAGRSWRVTRDDGRVVDLAFESGSRVAWREAGASGTDWYEAVEAADGLFFLDRTHGADPYRSDTALVDLGTGRAITVTSVIADVPAEGEPRVSQEFHAATVDTGDGAPPSGPVPGPTRDLIGWRALYRYSSNHLYEHVYLSSRRYAWQCLVGEQRGHGDVDLATTWKLGENRYVFTFREFLIPVATVWLYDLDAMRTTGKFFGLAADGTVDNSPGGAYIISGPRIDYPDGGEPV